MTTPGDMDAEHPELEELEELAALVDGRLSRERAARMRAHLATCAECREVFFETVDFVRDEEARKAKSPVLPFERPTRRAAWKSRLAVALPAAAVLALSASLVYVQFFAAPHVAWTKLASDLGHRQKRLEDGAFHVQVLRGNRSQGGEIDAQSFRLGVALVNLQVSLEGEYQQQADNALAKINELNEDLNPADDVKKFYYRLRTRTPKHLRQKSKEAERMADRFRSGGAANQDYLDFGTWTEAGHLAAAAEDAPFLASHNNRRFPTYLRRQLKKDGDSLPTEVETALRSIESVLDHDSIGAEDYRRLAEQYEKIMSFYDRAAEQEAQ